MAPEPRYLWLRSPKLRYLPENSAAKVSETALSSGDSFVNGSRTALSLKESEVNKSKIALSQGVIASKCPERRGRDGISQLDFICREFVSDLRAGLFLKSLDVQNCKCWRFTEVAEKDY